MEGCLGIDVSKDFLDAALSCGFTNDREPVRVPNKHEGFKKLLSQAKASGITKLYVCMEATNNYWKKAADFFYQKGMVVFVVNPSRIKAQRKVEQKRSKSDKIDAGVILRFLKANVSSLKPWTPPSQNVRELQCLTRYRETKVGQRTAQKNIIASKPESKLVMQMAREAIAKLDEEIKHLENAISELLRRDPILSKLAERAKSVRFVGLIGASVLIAECRAFAEISSPRQATAFAGLDVKEDTSGTLKKPPQISRQGSALLRKIFVCLAAGAIRGKGPLRDFYLNLVKRGKKKKQALVAVARKLLEITVAVVLSGKPFDESKIGRGITAEAA